MAYTLKIQTHYHEPLQYHSSSENGSIHKGMPQASFKNLGNFRLSIPGEGDVPTRHAAARHAHNPDVLNRPGILVLISRIDRAAGSFAWDFLGVMNRATVATLTLGVAGMDIVGKEDRPVAAAEGFRGNMTSRTTILPGRVYSCHGTRHIARLRLP